MKQAKNNDDDDTDWIRPSSNRSPTKPLQVLKSGTTFEVSLSPPSVTSPTPRCRLVIGTVYDISDIANFEREAAPPGGR